MGKIKVEAIAKEAKQEKGKQTKLTTSEALQVAKRLEGEIYGTSESTKSELVKLIERAEENASLAIREIYYDYVVKYTFAELRKFQKRYYKIIDDSEVTAEVAASPKFIRVKGEKRAEFHFAEVDKALFRDAKNIAIRLREGRKYTENFTKLASQTEKDGEKQLVFKEVTNLHQAFMALQRAPLAINYEKIKAEEERKRIEAEKAKAEAEAEAKRINRKNELFAKLASGQILTAKEMKELQQVCK